MDAAAAEPQSEVFGPHAKFPGGSLAQVGAAGEVMWSSLAQTFETSGRS